MSAEPQPLPSRNPSRRRRGRSPSVERVSAEDIIDWIEGVLFVPEGKLIAQPVKLLPFQKQAIRDIYDNPAGTRRAILSFGRKNGKTAFAAFLLLNHLCGPSGALRRNAHLFSTALSREQAGIIFGLAAKIVRMSPQLRAGVHIKDTAKELICPETGSKYRALSADASTAYGLSPSFVVHDELGQIKGPRSSLYEAMETATGAQEDPLSIIISTQASTDADLLSTLIDDAAAGHDPRTLLSLYTAPKESDPFSLATIKLANPALGTFLNKTEVLAMAHDAQRMPAREAEFRNLILNQRVETVNPFVSATVWKECGAAPADMTGMRLYGGLDLSSVSDLTALVLIGRKDKVWQVKPWFWLPEKGLAEKSAKDKVPYDQYAHDGHLLTTPGASVSYEHVAFYLRDEIFSRYKIAKIGFDKWNMKNLIPWLVKAGFTEYMIAETFVEFAQGTMSMSPALHALEEALREKQIAHGMHPVLTMCAANAVVYSKDESNRKLDKQKSTGRIDGMVALAMAIGIGSQLDKGFDIDAMLG